MAHTRTEIPKLVRDTILTSWLPIIQDQLREWADNADDSTLTIDMFGGTMGVDHDDGSRTQRGFVVMIAVTRDSRDIEMVQAALADLCATLVDLDGTAATTRIPTSDKGEC